MFSLRLLASVCLASAALQAAIPTAPGAEPVQVATGFGFTEGPAADAQGNVYFTDQRNDRIHRWDARSGEVTVFMEPAGRANGLYIDTQGTLWACADAKNELWAIDLKSKEHRVMESGHEGKLFNGPNDVWVAPSGGVYFTDPFFKRPYWERGPSELPQQVYYLAPGAAEAVRVTTDIKKPNGIVGSPDGKQLYVADPGAKVIRLYDIAADGSLENGRVFYPGGGVDGMTLDSQGNLYLAGAGGVRVVDPEGTLLGTLEIPERWTANVTFGGPDFKTLFITASKSVYTVEMTVAGAGR